MDWTAFSNRHWIMLHTNPTQYTKVMMDDFNQSILQNYVIQMGLKWHFCNLESSFLDWRCLFYCNCNFIFCFFSMLLKIRLWFMAMKSLFWDEFISKVEYNKGKWFIQTWGFNPCRYCVEYGRTFTERHRLILPKNWEMQGSKSLFFYLDFFFLHARAILNFGEKSN